MSDPVLLQRAALECHWIKSHDVRKVSDVWYLINADWIRTACAFWDNTDKSKLVLPPGPISNDALLNPLAGSPWAGLEPVVHYRGVSKEVWDYLHGIYGGGPAIRKQKIDIYGE